MSIKNVVLSNVPKILSRQIPQIVGDAIGPEQDFNYSYDCEKRLFRIQFNSADSAKLIYKKFSSKLLEEHNIVVQPDISQHPPPSSPSQTNS